jgi:dienelactone hydrolase
MKSFKVSCLLCVCLLMTLTVPVATFAGANEIPDPDLMGPYEIGFTQFMLIDASRNSDLGGRPIPVYVWYPVSPEDIDESTPEAVYPLDPVLYIAPPTPSFLWENHGLDRAYQEPPASSDGPFPTVIFSPGWGASALSALFVGTRLASHGFVVAVAYHWGDAAWPWEPFDPIAVAALNRPRDMSFMLTHLLARNGTPGDLLEDAIEHDQVAASGWSLGGYAAMTMAAGDDLVCDKFFALGFPDTPLETCVPTLPDPRIKAIVPLDGSNQLLWFDELARIHVPTLGIGQEWSTLEAQLGPAMASWQARLHAGSQGRPGFRVDVRDALHPTFSNLCEGVHVLFDIGLIDEGFFDLLAEAYCSAAIPTPDAYRLITKYMIAFLKKNVAGVPGYQNILTPGFALTTEPDIEFFVTEKANPDALDEDWPDDFTYFMHQPGGGPANADKNPLQMVPVQHMGLLR